MIYLQNSIPLPRHLPWQIERDIQILQGYYDENNEGYYYAYLDGFEGTIKGCYLEGMISREVAECLMARYGI